jgi:hypothetical protein
MFKKIPARLLVVAPLLLAGCASMGPATVERDRFDYVSGISESWKRQMLLNLLKVRYADAPVFMDVASVISSYSLEGEFRLGGEYANVGRGDTFGAIGATGRYADKPTITYQPLSGDKFARSLMAPIPVSGLLALIQAGYPADLVLRVCANSINGHENDFGGPANPRTGSAKFREILTVLRQTQTAGGAGFRTKATKDKQSVVMYLRPPGDESEPVMRRMRELLGLDPGALEATVVYGSFPEPEGDIAILTRSIMQVMIDLSSQVDVPDADVAEGRVHRRKRTAEQERLYPPLVAVRTGPEAPPDAYAAVRYRSRWHWIDDRDPQTKHALSFLMMLFSLTEGTQAQAAPVVTIPAR